MSVSPIEDYVTIKEASANPRVRYSEVWIRYLIRTKEVHAIRYGGEKRGLWLVNIKNLIRYAEEQGR